MELEEQIAKFKGVGSVRGVSVGIHGQCGDSLGDSRQRRSNYFRRTESRVDHRRLPRLSRATIKVFKHKDVADCERICKETKNWPGHKLLITDGVFSMDGDIAPLPELCDLAEKYNCIMMVDDAHSSGVLGRGGRGTVDHLGVPRARAHSGGHAQQSHRRDGRVRLRLARPDRFSVFAARGRSSFPLRIRRLRRRPARRHSRCWIRPKASG